MRTKYRPCYHQVISKYHAHKIPPLILIHLKLLHTRYASKKPICWRAETYRWRNETYFWRPETYFDDTGHPYTLHCGVFPVADGCIKRFLQYSNRKGNRWIHWHIEESKRRWRFKYLRNITASLDLRGNTTRIQVSLGATPTPKSKDHCDAKYSYLKIHYEKH